MNFLKRLFGGKSNPEPDRLDRIEQRANELLASIGLNLDTVTFEELKNRIEAHLGREIRFISYTKMPQGVFSSRFSVIDAPREYIIYRSRTEEPHKAHFQVHAMVDMLMGNPAFQVSQAQMDHLLDVGDPEMLEAGKQRVFAPPEEKKEVEELAMMIGSKVIKLDRAWLRSFIKETKQELEELEKHDRQD